MQNIAFMKVFAYEIFFISSCDAFYDRDDCGVDAFCDEARIWQQVLQRPPIQQLGLREIVQKQQELKKL